MRIRSSLINLGFAVVGQFLGILISFFARIVFIQVLGAEYLGLNGLFTNILSFLSLVELGIGPALTFSLYKPIADKDIEKIKSLMKIFRTAYISIGLCILLLGIIFTPFLGTLVNSSPTIPYIHLIFLLFVIDVAVSYFYSYKRSLIIADQKRYIATIYRYSFFIVLNIVQMIVLYLTGSFILFLICQIIVNFTENRFVSKTADKLYPYLRDRNIQKITAQEMKHIVRNIRAMFAHKLGDVVVNSTDIIIISRFVGLVGVGIYSNYQLIIHALKIVNAQLFTSITASVGNLGVTEAEDKKRYIFHIVFFMNFWIYGFASICLLVLMNPFIELWIGSDYVLHKGIVFVIILNFYLAGMRQGVLTFRDAFGIYWYDRHKPIFESIINLVCSLILVQELGIIGVLLGTTISTITTCFWVEPFVLYKHGFKSSVLPFFKRYVWYTAVLVIAYLVTEGVNSFFTDIHIVNFSIQLFICIVIPNIIFVVFFHRTEELIFLYRLRSKINLKKFMKNTGVR